MGVSKQQAIENKQAIVAAAAKLFRDRGVAAVGLAELTKAAGFTQGGFYNHFKSKDALVATVMGDAMDGAAAQFVASVEAAHAEAADPLRRRIEWYLSSEHRADIEEGCPISGFAGDIRRLSTQAQQSYAQGLARNFEQLASVIDGENSHEKRKAAIALFSQMVGALLLSRAVVEADPALADEILEDGRQAVGAGFVSSVA